MVMNALKQIVRGRIGTSPDELLGKKNTEQPIGMSGDKRVNVTQQSSVTVGDELLQGGEGEREQSGEGISSAMWEDSSKT